MKITDYFDGIFVINLDHRSDRWMECNQEFAKMGIPMSSVARWSACNDPVNPQSAGSRSHRELFRHIAEFGINRALVFEDDFEALNKETLRVNGFTPESKVMATFCSIMGGNGNASERFSSMSGSLPDDWDILYLGGGYAENPISRLNRHVIRCGAMKCCSSYGITGKFAAEFSGILDDKTGGDVSFNPGAADDMISITAHTHRHFILQPRIFIQRRSLSDLSKKMEYHMCSMTDPVHENTV